jgi:hypothetical protein
VLRVDDFIAMTAPSLPSGVALALLRARFALAFHRTVVFPAAAVEAASAGKIPADFKARDSAFVESIASALAGEVISLSPVAPSRQSGGGTTALHPRSAPRPTQALRPSPAAASASRPSPAPMPAPRPLPAPMPAPRPSPAPMPALRQLPAPTPAPRPSPAPMPALRPSLAPRPGPVLISAPAPPPLAARAPPSRSRPAQAPKPVPPPPVTAHPSPSANRANAAPAFSHEDCADVVTQQAVRPSSFFAAALARGPPPTALGSGIEALFAAASAHQKNSQ